MRKRWPAPLLLVVVLFLLVCGSVVPQWARYIAVHRAADGDVIDRWFCASISWAPGEVKCAQPDETVLIILGEGEYVTPVELD